MAEILAGLDAVGRRAALDGDPTADQHATQEEDVKLGTTIADQEAWKLSGNLFWGNYLARITQYTLIMRYGDDHTILQEARRWSMARMLGCSETFRKPRHGERVVC